MLQGLHVGEVFRTDWASILGYAAGRGMPSISGETCAELAAIGQRLAVSTD